MLTITAVTISNEPFAAIACSMNTVTRLCTANRAFPTLTMLERGIANYANVPINSFPGPSFPLKFLKASVPVILVRSVGVCLYSLGYVLDAEGRGVSPWGGVT